MLESTLVRFKPTRTLVPKRLPGSGATALGSVSQANRCGQDPRGPCEELALIRRKVQHARVRVRHHERCVLRPLLRLECRDAGGVS